MIQIYATGHGMAGTRPNYLRRRCGLIFDLSTSVMEPVHWRTLYVAMSLFIYLLLPQLL